MRFAWYSRADRDTDIVRQVGGPRFRTPVTLIDRLVVLLGAAALLAGLVALFGSLDVRDREPPVDWNVTGHELRRWQLVVLLIVFAGLVVLYFAGRRRVQRASSLATLGIALAGFVVWWWAALDGFLAQASIDARAIELDVGMVLAGSSLGLQIVVGILMFTAAFPLATRAAVTPTRPPAASSSLRG